MRKLFNKRSNGFLVLINFLKFFSISLHFDFHAKPPNEWNAKLKPATICKRFFEGHLL